MELPASFLEARHLNCDICGRNISGQAFRVKVEGAKLLVCNSCQSLGKPYHEEPILKQPSSPSRTRVERRVAVGKVAEFPKGMDELDIAEDYAERVRRQRMKLGLSQEALAKRLKERLSVIQKIEIAKMMPDERLCRELEHELRIKLLVQRKELSEVPRVAPPSRLTLGDIIRVKGKAKDEISL